jgi:Phage integrase family
LQRQAGQEHGMLLVGERSVDAAMHAVDGGADVGGSVVEVNGIYAGFAWNTVHGPVFTAPQGGTLRIVAFRNRIWRLATDAAGLTGLRIHDLRHTAVALWIAAGASPKEVAVRAGHTSVSFTLDRYGHLYPEADTRLRDRLDSLHATARRPEGVVVDLLGQDMRSRGGADTRYRGQ